METFLMSVSSMRDGTIVKSSCGTFFKGTRWTLASANPVRQTAEAINAAVSFMMVSCKRKKTRNDPRVEGESGKKVCLLKKSLLFGDGMRRSSVGDGVVG
jgi:hypothetical protein